MAKIEKWKNLKAELERGQEEFAAIPNPTAEQCGMCQAYAHIGSIRKKLDKA